MALEAGSIEGICTVPEAARLLGITTTTLNWWDVSGFVSPSKLGLRGRRPVRLYSFQDLVALRVANRLREAGISLQGLRRVVSYLQDRDGSKNPLASTYLIAVDDDVCECRSDKELLSVLKQPGQLKLVVDLGEAERDIQHGIEELQAA